MITTLWDHALVLTVLILVFPLIGAWSYRRFLARAAIEGEPALIREYQQTIFFWLTGLALVTIAVWLGQGRPLRALFTTDEMLFDSNLGVGLAGGLAVVLLVRPILALRSPKAAAQIAETLQPFAPFLPKSRKALWWGTGVSMAAGVAEEIAYRGFLIAYLSSMAPIGVAIGVGAVVFGAAHLYQGVGGMLGTTVLGAILAVIFVSTGSLLLPVLLHTLIDVSAMVTAYLVLGPRSRPSPQGDGAVPARG